MFDVLNCDYLAEELYNFVMDDDIRCNAYNEYVLDNDISIAEYVDLFLYDEFVEYLGNI